MSFAPYILFEVFKLFHFILEKGKILKQGTSHIPQETVVLVYPLKHFMGKNNKENSILFIHRLPV